MVIRTHIKGATLTYHCTCNMCRWPSYTHSSHSDFLGCSSCNNGHLNSGLLDPTAACIVLHVYGTSHCGRRPGIISVVLIKHKNGNAGLMTCFNWWLLFTKSNRCTKWHSYLSCHAFMPIQLEGIVRAIFWVSRTIFWEVTLMDSSSTFHPSEFWSTSLENEMWIWVKKKTMLWF